METIAEASTQLAYGHTYFTELWDSEVAKFYANTFPFSEIYPLVSPNYLAWALMGYAVLCVWGYMRMTNGRKPIIKDGRSILRVYNVIQVVLSAYISYLATKTYLLKIMEDGNPYGPCQPMISGTMLDVSVDPKEYELATFTTWLFYISKWVDFMDTFFIIARSKWRQFSFLHVFHHSSMIALCWIATHYHPCGYFLIAAQLNAPVHTVMYSYYFLSSFPSLVPFLWWKNWITTLQLAQFLAGTGISAFCLIRQVALGYPYKLSIFFTLTFILYGLILFWLFHSFYQATYKKSGRGDSSEKKKSAVKSKKDT